SDKALRAQRSVMEFLLINHPLDCPICDQGGECQLQDLAVGYGASASRYEEEKRVVLPKDVGPLVSMEEMTRCIHCTRCVRFGQELAGAMELGMIHRGEHAEITTVTGGTIDSELSGNMIDLCPVGALTSKPFRYSARTWELSRRKSISPHDSTGANLIVQVKGQRVMRVLPLENEAVNQCWIADRDRFSYEALNAPERLLAPRIKQGGEWQTVDWPTALDYVADGLKRVRAEFGAAAIGALGAPQSTVEELHLLARLVRGLGSENVDHRLRHADFGAAAGAGRARWLGMPVAELSTLDRALVIGSFLRKDHPLFALRLRHAVRHGAQLHSLHALADDWAIPVAQHVVAPPSGWVDALAGIAAALAQTRGVDAPVTVAPQAIGDTARAIAASLSLGERKAVLLGNAAVQHPRAGELLALANWIGEATGARVGVFGEGGNSVGAQLVGALPGPGGLDAGRMLREPMKALLLLGGIEAALDAADAGAATQALRGAGLVVALTPFADTAAEAADVMLPIAPFTETAGAFVNAEGRLQTFHGVVRPLGETRPGWKVLRVLGNLLELPGFGYETVEEVRAEALGAEADDLSARMDNSIHAAPTALAAPFARGDSIERIADVPIYSSDALVRRAPSLQRTADAQRPRASLPSALRARLGVAAGDRVRVTQGAASVSLPALEEASLADGTVRVVAGHPDTAALGAMFGPLTVEKA
ncbi:MAG: NADH-quinone oxidoreductase subunit NuoG, partial [Rubrivivax sp.]